MNTRRGDVILVLFATIPEAEIDSTLGLLSDMSGVDAALKHTLALG